MKNLRIISSILLFCIFSMNLIFAEERLLRLEEMNLEHMVQGWGKPGVKKTILDKPLTINGKVFEHGVGTHAVSRFTIDLRKSALEFRAMVGLDDETSEFEGTVTFHVYVDKVKKYDSGVMKLGDGAKEVNVDLKGASRLDLEVMDGGDTVNYDHANWADAVLALDPDAEELPVSLPRKKLPREILTPPTPDVPRINAPGVIGAGECREFSYYIPITGKRPMTINVDGLPEGLSLDSEKGMITGNTPDPSTWPLTIHVVNSHGSDEKKVKLVIGEGLALTPPMGWNSWNCWGSAVTDENIREAAQALVDTDLINHGFSYVTIDDTWEGTRDPETLRITSNEKFPDMKALGDFIHSKGLKFGIYTDLGYKTCQGLEGSRGHDYLDAQTFARWGADYVKADWCYAYGMNPKASYTTFAYAIEATGRDMVFSICTAGHGEPWAWGEEAGGNLWRTCVDIRDNWHSVYTSVSKDTYRLYDYAKPGHWNDPDMLVVGKVGWGQPLHDSQLLPEQQYSHISLWCLLSSPLILGCDLTQMDDFTLGLLRNHEVLAINQDTLGKQARRIIKENRFEVWVKELADGNSAIGIFNLSPSELEETAPREFTLEFKDIGLEPKQRLRDLWRQEDMGEYEDSLTVNLPPFGVKLVKAFPIR